MQITGIEHIRQLLETGEGFEAKCVFNRNGAIFFPAQLQHRDQKAPGVSYADNYKGGAMAAMVTRERFEIRYHERFRDADVAEIVTTMAAIDGLDFLRSCSVTYQGRAISLR
ncbi:MAG TPA: hypothetical protein P5081_12810 [Phycisphaerae bacterium]|nr:hypothetical protein [Phycisphaerae bacterium]HRW53758.1 hypothetical protein [Phycisphaerae bacterium]